MSRVRAGASLSSAEPLRALREYVRLSELPLTCLIFVVPLMIAYELGMAHYTHGRVQQIPPIIAFDWMRRFFVFFGATGRYLPAMAVGAILITWHIARKDPWSVDVPTVVGMIAESILLGLPLLVLGNLVHRYMPLFPGSVEWRSNTVMCIGAGVYEELVFRLILFTLLHILFIDAFEIPKAWGSLLIVVSSAVLFSLYHYLGAEAFSWETFTFRTLAGAYFGLIFLTRGFGVTVGSHAAYDVTVVLLITSSIR